VLSCLPIEYIVDIQEAISGTSTTLCGSARVAGAKIETDTSFIRLLRFAKFGKLMRLSRLKRLFVKYEETLDLNQYIGITVNILLAVIALHFLACFWFLMGEKDPDYEYPAGQGPWRYNDGNALGWGADGRARKSGAGANKVDNVESYFASVTSQAIKKSTIALSFLRLIAA